MRERNWLIFFAIPGVILLLALGSWQTYRLFWKLELNNFRSEQVDSQPVMLPKEIVDKDNWNFRPVYVDGKFQHEQEIYLAARSFRSQVGYQIITPLETLDGRIILINRGWVPESKKDPVTRLEGQVSGITRVNGLITFGQTDSFMKPENRPIENIWFWIDLDRISLTLNIPKQKFIIDMKVSKSSNTLPIGGQTRIEMRNEHFQYAMVWFLLAVALAVITYIIRRRAKSEIKKE